MKRILVLALLFVTVLACGQTIIYHTQGTLQWDPPTVDSAGNPLLPTDVLTYDVYIYNYTVGVGNPQDTAQLTFIASTSAHEQLIVFPSRAVWAAGVRTKLTDAGGNVSYSTIAWSYVLADADVVVGPFVYSPSGLPTKPTHLKDKGT
jgi:hypothetical protein